MATRAQVTDLLDVGHSYETAARELKIPPGLAYMIATGLPADGSGAPAPAELTDQRLAASSQDLLNPRSFNPTRDPTVIDWVRDRAVRDLTAPR